MTTINSAVHDYAATRNFMDTPTVDARARGFGGLDSTAHAMIDRADIAGDGKTLYGADIPDLMSGLLDTVSQVLVVPKTVATIAKDIQVGDAGSNSVPREIIIPTALHPKI
ncbi:MULTISPECIES: hypothetical protein [unclassified Achromobacter]|uniref:hypothetical protein n=1 Tax=unclassified Achromobacter TaxID=2626865 RepID=UPI000B51587E|nr:MULTISPECIES: hypothetical protein [unclassified Achromobacter]OWT68143.1 hypothetical protein CEY05_29380 [Achromobacter sp. HZ34]OWT69980.1 hypothetical protein CEY04_28210 [Achromobacter sp. HZ28]